MTQFPEPNLPRDFENCYPDFDAVRIDGMPRLAWGRQNGFEAMMKFVRTYEQRLAVGELRRIFEQFEIRELFDVVDIGTFQEFS